MTEQELIKFKQLSMQDGKLNLSWFADYVAQAEREACAKMCEEYENDMGYGQPQKCADAIRARSKE